MLECLMNRPTFSLTIGELYSEVWSGIYNPLLHEGKIHVTLHRLRSWLDDKKPGTGALIEVTEGTVCLSEHADVRVLEPRESRGDLRADAAPSMRDRVLATLRGEDTAVAPGLLRRRLGVSRSAVHVALRALMAADLVRREGSGRNTRYRALC